MYILRVLLYSYLILYGLSESSAQSNLLFSRKTGDCRHGDKTTLPFGNEYQPVIAGTEKIYTNMVGYRILYSTDTGTTWNYLPLWYEDQFPSFSYYSLHSHGGYDGKLVVNQSISPESYLLTIDLLKPIISSKDWVDLSSDTTRVMSRDYSGYAHLDKYGLALYDTKYFWGSVQEPTKWSIDSNIYAGERNTGANFFYLYQSSPKNIIIVLNKSGFGIFNSVTGILDTIPAPDTVGYLIQLTDSVFIAPGSYTDSTTRKFHTRVYQTRDRGNSWSYTDSLQLLDGSKRKLYGETIQSVTAGKNRYVCLLRSLGTNNLEILCTSDLGRSWRSVHQFSKLSTLPQEHRLLPETDTTVLYANDQYVLRLHNSGAIDTLFEMIRPNSRKAGLVSFYNDTNIILAGLDDALIQSKDKGKTWQYVPIPDNFPILTILPNNVGVEETPVLDITFDTTTQEIITYTGDNCVSTIKNGRVDFREYGFKLLVDGKWAAWHKQSAAFRVRGSDRNANYTIQNGSQISTPTPVVLSAREFMYFNNTGNVVADIVTGITDTLPVWAYSASGNRIPVAGYQCATRTMEGAYLVGINQLGTPTDEPDVYTSPSTRGVYIYTPRDTAWVRIDTNINNPEQSIQEWGVWDITVLGKGTDSLLVVAGNSYTTKDNSPQETGVKMTGLDDCKIYRTLDGGKTWNVVYSERYRGYIKNGKRSIKHVNNGTPLGIYYHASVHNGLVYSTDAGATWQEYEDEVLLYNNVNALCVVGDSIMYVGSDIGLHSIKLTPLTSIDAEIYNDDNSRVTNVWVQPTPANSTVTVRLNNMDLTQRGVERLVLTDINGTTIEDLTQQARPANGTRRYEFTLDISHLATGTYFLNLKTYSGKSSTKEVVVVR